MGNVEILAAAKPAAGGGNLLLLVGIIAFIGLMYFTMFRPQRNRQRQIQQAQNAIVPGQQVRTTAGMYATVVSIDDGDVVLEVAPGVNVRYMRRAIMEVIPSGTDADAMGESGAAGEAGVAGVTDQSVNGSGPATETGAAGAKESGAAAE
ncbi:MAG TPA: preprotein translocase subunit YajC [Actinobacteria bacterium]|nr:preprotein translocase subunit YajC [Actinomycetota bacterium]